MAGGCRGCGDVYLTGAALELLERLGETAFLPVGERDGRTVYISETGEEFSRAVLALSMNGLATVDLDVPLQGFDYAGFEGCTRLGSMALTKRGQDALESISVLGVEE